MQEQSGEGAFTKNQTATPKINLNINICRGGTVKGKRNPQTEALLNRLPPGMLTALRKHEDEVFNWLQKDPRNPYLFVSDPVKALQEAVPNMNGELLEKLRQVRGSQSAKQMATPNVELGKLTINTTR